MLHKYAENQQVTESIHNFVHSFYELCIFSFIVPHYTQTAPEARSEVDKSLPRPRIFRETPTPYVAPDTKILPLIRKAGNFLHCWPEGPEGRLRLAASCSRAPRHLGHHGCRMSIFSFPASLNIVSRSNAFPTSTCCISMVISLLVSISVSNYLTGPEGFEEVGHIIEVNIPGSPCKRVT